MAPYGLNTYFTPLSEALFRLLNLPVDRNYEQSILLVNTSIKERYYAESIKTENKRNMAILGSGIKDGLFVYVGSNNITATAVFKGKASAQPFISSPIGIAIFADKLPCLKNCHLTQVVQQLFYVASNYDKEKTIVENMAPRECKVKKLQLVH
jgi:hypothetical protein